MTWQEEAAARLRRGNALLFEKKVCFWPRWRRSWKGAAAAERPFGRWIWPKRSPGN